MQMGIREVLRQRETWRRGQGSRLPDPGKGRKMEGEQPHKETERQAGAEGGGQQDADNSRQRARKEPDLEDESGMPCQENKQGGVQRETGERVGHAKQTVSRPHGAARTHKGSKPHHEPQPASL